MARRSGSSVSEEELFPAASEPARDVLDDSRLVDLDVEQESPFLRAQKRVSVRQSSLPKKTAKRLRWGALGVGILLVLGSAAAGLYQYSEHSWRFRLESSDNLEISGNHNVTRAQILEIMGGDIGRNIFFVPLAQRKQELEQIPWVESASIMRFVPNRLRIEIRERTPAAFARLGSKIFLIDDAGSLMELPAVGRKQFSFPVVLGMTLSEPQSMRAVRMKTYNQLIGDLDSDGGHYSQELSEVDLSDPEDVKVLATDPGGEVLVHLGSSNFLERFKIFKGHVQEWRQQFAHLNSVDLRYDHQIVVNPDLQGTMAQPPLPRVEARTALAAGVKPTALVSREALGQQSNTVTKTAAAKKKAPAKRRRKAALRRASTKHNVGATPTAPAVSSSTAVAAPRTGPVLPSITGAAQISKPSPEIPKGQQE
jgi:cell division protein FtsQ